MADFLSVKVSWKIAHTEKWLGRGRPGPKRVKQDSEHYRARVSVQRRAKALETFKQQAGWPLLAPTLPGRA